MSHHVYTTEAFILESAPSGEANKSYWLLTQDFGRIFATAQGVRLSKSKLRTNLQDYSKVLLSVVRGKEVWRITNARLLENFYAQFKEKKDIVKIIAQINALLKRLVPEDEKHEELFHEVSAGFQFLGEMADENKELIKYFEYVLVMRILNALGYMKQVRELHEFLSGAWSEEMLLKVGEVKDMALKEINAALRETHL